ncbi:hypothetical protein ACFQJD_18640 [Haloplanus sp. GCM10025708]|uniref:hypothetical protein n=1 Tax=Haloferacaceae TaxID=1644056 RepID=UPI00360A0FC5
MSETITEVEIRDTNPHSFTFDADSPPPNRLQFCNDLDAEVSISISATRVEDATFEDAHEIATATLPSGENEYLEIEPWPRTKLHVTPTTEPTQNQFRAYLIDNDRLE